MTKSRHIKNGLGSLGPRIDLTGQAFGKLTVLHLKGLSAEKRPKYAWLCRCECGKEVAATTPNLRSGNTQSCGCHKLENTKKANSRHGQSNTYLHNAWRAMQARCDNPKTRNYGNYGGRGISFSPLWRGSDGFVLFAEHIGQRPTPKHSVDRINTNGNYEPGNVRWATSSQQSRNTRKTQYVEWGGERRPLIEICEGLGLPVGTISWRLRAGWCPDRALSTPIAGRK